MNILLTGGSGFVGSHVMAELLSNHHSVVLLKRKSSDTHRIRKMLPMIKAYDMNEKTNLVSIISKHSVDAVIHLAGKYIKHHTSYEEIEDMNNSNIDFPIKILEAAAMTNVKYFINTGTFFEYKLKGEIRENSPSEPYDYYASTKKAFEEILKYYASKYSMRVLTLKLFSPYGERDNEKVIPLIIRAAINKRKIPLTKGSQKLCFTYVGDIARAYQLGLAYLRKSKKTAYENINIGERRSVSIKTCVKHIEAISGKKDFVIYGKVLSVGDAKVNIVCNNAKAKKLLGWMPNATLLEGLRRTFNYYNSI